MLRNKYGGIRIAIKREENTKYFPRPVFQQSKAGDVFCRVLFATYEFCRRSTGMESSFIGHVIKVRTTPSAALSESRQSWPRFPSNRKK
ncbi:hypothetical protein CEXT_348311 [Caerostris extrusa]|uniref:Uncharacterized protein n=1 Tax=Caerostris extrusa TaxID=172846 RepID=A0AAV4URU7_CAEEX|nr:hypothetical protein CEXT_348311 [Caerostris extrusa]